MRAPVWLIGSVAIWLAACGGRHNEAVSLAEAKRVVAQFGGQGFVPPPRTVTDITVLLESAKPASAELAANLAIAKAPPPANMAPADLAEFYFRRTAAAAVIGRDPQRFADARAALDHGLKANLPFNRINAFRNALVSAEIQVGHPKSAYNERLAQLDAARGQPIGWSLSTLAILANATAELGKLDEAAGYLARAKETLRRLSPRLPEFEGDDTRLIAEAEGRIALTSGRFSDAEQAFRRAFEGMGRFIAVYDRLDAKAFGLAPRYLYQANRNEYRWLVAESLLGQGRVVEAEVETRTVLIDSLQLFGKSGATRRGVLMLSRVLLGQGRVADAEQLARASLDMAVAGGLEPSSRPVVAARSQRAAILGFQGRFEEQLSEFATLRASLQGDPEGGDRFLYRNPVYAVAVSRAGRHDEALAIMKAAVVDRERALGPEHALTVQARGQLGIVLLAAGERDQALAEFRRVIPALLRDAPLALRGTATRRVTTIAILEAYISLLMSLPDDTGDLAAEAFRIADAARDQDVLGAVSASLARARLGTPDLIDLARLEQDARQQLAGLQTALAEAISVSASQRDEGGIATLLQRTGQLRTSQAALRQELERRFPDYARLLYPRPAAVSEARAALRPGEVLIATYVGMERTYVWAVPQSGPMRTAVVPLPASQIRDMVSQLRRALDPQVSLVGDIPAFDLALAHRLFAVLLEPVRAAWAGATHLVVVPDKALGQIPFTILVTRPTRPAEAPGQALFASYKSTAWLLREVAITQVPSVATLVGLRASAAANPGRKPFIGFGDPWFSPSQAAAARAGTVAAGPHTAAIARGGLSAHFRGVPGTSKMRSADLSKLPRLPDTAEEVRAIAVALNADPDKDVYLGAAVNERTLRTADLLNRRVVVFATHGLVPGDLDGLNQPALALSSPEVSGAEGDGLLTMDKVLGLRLNADWVVLSGCNTAAGDGAGAEALSGLGRAFFYAGTRALLASNWPVETSAARALTTGMFQRQAADPSLTGAEALRLAQIALSDGPGAVDAASGKILFSYAHPIFWAPFSLVGDGAVATRR